MRIAIVNDAAMAVEALRRVVTGSDEHQLAWIARDGAEAVECCAEQLPDLILMDLIMPIMDGVEACRRIMTSTPCAILIVTATVEGHSAKVFEALGAGALDVVSTPVLGTDATAAGAGALLLKINQIRRIIGGERRGRGRGESGPDAPQHAGVQDRLVAVGASAGGPAALATILRGLPRDFPAAIVVVQHVDEQFVGPMAGWLDEQSDLRVRVAREGDKPVANEVLIAGGDDHLVFTGARTLGYTPDPRDCSYRPSVDVFFESVIQHWKGQVVGVLLTGMGRDGAKGLKAMRDAGATTIAQDHASCAVYGMPKAAAQMNAAVEILPLDEIALTLIDVFTLHPNRKS
jgi:two-component system response regulator WspF